MAVVVHSPSSDDADELEQITFEIEALRSFIRRHDTIGGAVVLDGRPATGIEVALLKSAIARFVALLELSLSPPLALPH